MELPWTTGTAAATAAGTAATAAAAAGQQPASSPGTVVMGSRFELKSAWRSPAFLLMAMRIWRQARRSPGMLGVSLRAHPVSGVYWTLSAWTDEAALRDFARTDPHRTIMKKARPWTREATFRFWTVPADKLSPAGLWPDAQARISAPEDVRP